MLTQSTGSRGDGILAVEDSAVGSLAALLGANDTFLHPHGADRGEPGRLQERAPAWTF